MSKNIDQQDRTTATTLLKDNIMPSIKLHWGDGFDQLGPSLQRSLVLAQAFLATVTLPEGMFEDSNIRLINNALWRVINDEFPGVEV